MNIKEKLKGVKVFNIMNANIKSYKYFVTFKLIRFYYYFFRPEPSKAFDFDSGMNKIINQLPANNKDVIVLYVGTNYDQDYSGFIQGLSELCLVEVFYNRTGSYGLNLNDINGNKTIFDCNIRLENGKDIYTKVKELSKKYNVLLIGQMLSNYVSVDYLLDLRRDFKCPIINISMDDMLYHNWISKQGVKLGGVGLAKATDLVLTTTPDCVSWYRSHRVNAEFFPLGSSSKLFYSDNANRDIDVLFIGNKYGIRQDYIEFLLKNDIKVDAWGNGWLNGPSSFEKSIELSKRAKIILGFGSVGHGERLFTMKLRDFDAPMSGALYVTHRSKVIKKIYKENEEVVLFSNKYDCLSQVKKYLLEENERVQIASSGQLKAQHSYEWVSILAKIINPVKNR